MLSSTFGFWISSLWSMKSGDLLQAFSDQPKYVFSFWKQVLISKLHWNSSIWQFYSAIYFFYPSSPKMLLPQYQCKSGPRNIILYQAIPRNCTTWQFNMAIWKSVPSSYGCHNCNGIAQNYLGITHLTTAPNHWLVAKISGNGQQTATLISDDAKERQRSIKALLRFSLI